MRYILLDLERSRFKERFLFLLDDHSLAHDRLLNNFTPFIGNWRGDVGDPVGEHRHERSALSAFDAEIAIDHD